MKSSLYISLLSLSVLLALSPVSEAQKLPSIQNKPWLGFFSGYEHRSFHFGVGCNGQCELHLMKSRKQRASPFKAVKFYIEVHAVNAAGKTFVKRLKEDEGLHSKQKAGTDHEEVVYTALASNESMVQVSAKYDDKRVILDGKLLDRGKNEKDDLFLVIKVKMPSFYNPRTYGKSYEKAKAKMKRDSFRVTRAKDGKRLSLKVYDKYKYDSEEVAGDGITKLESDMDAQEGKRITVTTLNGKGVLKLESTKKGAETEPWRGYYLKWARPLEEEKGKEMSPMVIEVK